MSKKYIAELVGTFILVFLAVGSAIAGGTSFGPVDVALCFGLVLVALCYTIGPISGCHVNPAITLGQLIAKRIDVRDAVGYWIAQFVGAIAAAALLKLLVSSFGKVKDQTGALGTNGWGAGHGINFAGALVIEIVMTFVLVFVVLMVTEKWAVAGFAGVAIGLVLAAIHVFGIPLDGTSVNPARLVRPGPVRGRHGAAPGLAVHRGPADRRGARRRGEHRPSFGRRAHRSGDGGALHRRRVEGVLARRGAATRRRRRGRRPVSFGP